ncbi:beta-lactamase family protein [Microbacterium sp. LRZ72]|uniref:serine hydrolase domain-containing protein n=1 Tax=Microbacterium sp. LRZ72 TaxID=2942481 RepID=UPI0029AC2496|nr:serine hydrolase domain-containing protein [Microbacterium sp. LRZ72]MDX2376123.1 beta-lactamase family protein [Microbacterium sp. LRZ72]
MAARSWRRRAWALWGGLAGMGLMLTACSPEVTLDVDVPEQAEQALPDDMSEELDEAVRTAMEATGSSGAIAGVWAPWSGSWVEGFGTDATGADVTSDMTFRIADVTRLMTCDLLYTVAGEGELALDDPVTDYVSGYPNLEDVALVDLCNGTGGLGSYTPSLVDGWIENPDRVWDPLELASFGLGQPRSAVGSQYRDSDAGYVLIGLALERATGMSASQLYETYIFEPLELESTLLPSATASVPGERPMHGEWIPSDGDGELRCEEPKDVSLLSASAGFTNAGVVSTVPELGRYLQALGAGAFQDDDQPERWQPALPATSSAPAWYTAAGGGIIAGPLIGQNGSLPGYMTAGFTDPETGLTVVVTLNNSTTGANAAAYLARQLAAIAAGAPAASGFTDPALGLPWTAEQYRETIAGINVCR